MKNILYLCIICFTVILYSCSAMDSLFEEETLVDPSTGKVVNKEAIPAEEREKITLSNLYLEKVKSSSTVVSSSEMKYLMDDAGRLMVIVHNPHPSLKQRLRILNEKKEQITNSDFNSGVLEPGAKKQIHLYPGTYYFEWTAYGFISEVPKIVTNAPAGEWYLNELCHNYSYGFDKERNY